MPRTEAETRKDLIDPALAAAGWICTTLTKSLAAGLAPLGVRVKAVCPGLIDEGQALSEERRATAQGIPAGWLGSPAEVVYVVKWLVTESPSYVTSTLVPVVGAWEY
jgi:NAD(P)-dependent dehydrogenase (short-subunit alcohol dehydrogenase family)